LLNRNFNGASIMTAQKKMPKNRTETETPTTI